jgi:hypothetical protein
LFQIYFNNKLVTENFFEEAVTDRFGDEIKFLKNLKKVFRNLNEVAKILKKLLL